MLAQTNASYQCTFNLRNLDNTPYDLSGKKFKMQFKNVPGSGYALEASTDNGRLSNGADPTLGKLLFSVPRTVMETLQPDTYFFDNLQQGDVDNDYLICRGLWRVYDGITNRNTGSLAPLSGGLHCADSITILVVASTIQVSVAGAAPPLLGYIPAFAGVPPAPATGGFWFFDTTDNRLKIIFFNDMVKDVLDLAPDPT